MTDDNAKRVARHLEFLGYTTSGPDADGWWRAEHPRRWNIHIQPAPLGTRVHCGIQVGVRAMHKKAWHLFLNRFNEQAIVARATLSQDPVGTALVRVKALLPPTYERRLFGALLDAWHSDLEYMANAPPREDAQATTDSDDAVH